MPVRKINAGASAPDMNAIIAAAVAQALAGNAGAVMAAPVKAVKPPVTWAGAEVGHKADALGNAQAFKGVWFTDSRGGRMFIGQRKLKAVLAFVDVCKAAL